MNSAERLGEGDYPLLDGAAPLAGLSGPTSQVLPKRPDTLWEAHISERATDPAMESIKSRRGLRPLLRHPCFPRLLAAHLISQALTKPGPNAPVTPVSPPPTSAV